MVRGGCTFWFTMGCRGTWFLACPYYYVNIGLVVDLKRMDMITVGDHMTAGNMYDWPICDGHEP